MGVQDVLCMWQLVFASHHRLIPQEEEEQEDAKRVPDDHGRSFGFWPWQKLRKTESDLYYTGSLIINVNVM